MVSVKGNLTKSKLLNLSDVIRDEQKKLLEEAADFDLFPNKSLIRQIAELELTIVAVDNYLSELNIESEPDSQ